MFFLVGKFCITNLESDMTIYFREMIDAYIPFWQEAWNLALLSVFFNGFMT